MYTWPESTARRGCREVASCFHHFIQTKVPATVKHLDVFSDGCRGQHHNNTMIRFLFTLVHSYRFESIDFHLPIRRHSLLPCDREFGVIERMKRQKDTVKVYSEWREMIATKLMSLFYVSSCFRHTTWLRSEGGLQVLITTLQQLIICVMKVHSWTRLL